MEAGVTKMHDSIRGRLATVLERVSGTDTSSALAVHA
jgi:hypothetical protein